MRKSWTKGTQAQQMTPLGSGEEGYQGFDYGGAKPKGGHKPSKGPGINQHLITHAMDNDSLYICGREVDFFSTSECEASTGEPVSCNGCQRELNRRGHKTGDMARSFQPSELIDG